MDGGREGGRKEGPVAAQDFQLSEAPIHLLLPRQTRDLIPPHSRAVPIRVGAVFIQFRSRSFAD